MKKMFFAIMAFGLVTISGFAQVEVLLEEPFAESLGSFTLDEQKYPGCTYASMWYVDKTYKYAKVTANKSGQSLGASDCKLISPVLNTQGCTHVYLRFEHTTYAANSTSDVDYCMVKVSKDGKTWTKVTIPTWPTKRWGFVACEMDLSEYASSTMQVMFEYVSTASYAGTWEVKNVVVEGWWPGEPDVPDCPYEALEGLTSKELRESLHEEIKDHTVLTYKQIRGDQAEVDVHENGKIWDMYSAYEFNLSDYCHDIDVIAGECYNREHILPKSWWGYSEANEANDPMYTDLHHVISTDAVANDTRSNYIYDEVKNATWTNCQPILEPLSFWNSKTAISYSSSVPAKPSFQTSL